jgi:hypothetical protein
LFCRYTTLIIWPLGSVNSDAGSHPQAAISIALKISPARQPGGPKPMPVGIAIGRSDPQSEPRFAAEYKFWQLRRLHRLAGITVPKWRMP